jgi:hypothetical protein
MPRARIFDFNSLPADYLDQAIAGLDVGREYPVRREPWRRIPLDLLPVRSRQLRGEGDVLSGTYFVLPHELAHAICRSLGGDCGRLDEEPIAVWAKCCIVIRRYALRIGR